jgi:hypothetical protein
MTATILPACRCKKRQRPRTYPDGEVVCLNCGVVLSAAREPGLIFLACRECDRTDFEGVEKLPTDWSDLLDESDGYKAAAEVWPEGDEPELGPWWNWSGVCADCAARLATSEGRLF